jgi:hypothetical protein
MGGLLAGVEDRLKAYVRAVGDGGLVSHFTGPDNPDGPLQRLAATDRERWFQAMRPIEPISFIGQAAPAALLFKAGTMDELIPQEDARRDQQAPASPRRSAGTRPAILATGPSLWSRSTIRAPSRLRVPPRKDPRPCGIPSLGSEAHRCGATITWWGLWAQCPVPGGVLGWLRGSLGA